MENSNTFPQFQEGLDIFKSYIKQLVNDKESKTFYKFGDGDYYFLTKQSFGSATPGSRALSVSYDEINHEALRLLKYEVLGFSLINGSNINKVRKRMKKKSKEKLIVPKWLKRPVKTIYLKLFQKYVERVN